MNSVVSNNPLGTINGGDLTASLTCCNPQDFYSITEINRLAERTVKQVVMVFSGGGESDVEELTVLSGQKFGENWTEAPSINMVINLILNLQMQLREAVVFHNHPCLPWHGELIPTKEDIISTELLKWQFALLGIELVDHIILSGIKNCSLRQMGLYNGGSLRIKGFELHRFLYSFLTQVSETLEHDAALGLLLTVLEKKLKLLGDYYDKAVFARIWDGKPVGDDFKLSLSKIECADPLLKQLIETLAKVNDNRKVTIHPERVRVYGAELQRKIIDHEYQCRA